MERSNFKLQTHQSVSFRLLWRVSGLLESRDESALHAIVALFRDGSSRWLRLVRVGACPPTIHSGPIFVLRLNPYPWNPNCPRPLVGRPNQSCCACSLPFGMWVLLKSPSRYGSSTRRASSTVYWPCARRIVVQEFDQVHSTSS